jgi:acid-sensing ion channel, other
MDTKSIVIDKKSAKKLKKNQKPTKFSSIKLLWTSLVYQVREFFNNSTLHGVRYIAEDGRPFGEKYVYTQKFLLSSGFW